MPNTRRLTPDALAANPLADLAKYYATIGHVFAKQRNWDRALIWFERALSYVPEDDGYGCLVATMLENVGRLPEAISAAGDVIRTGAAEACIVDALAIIGRCCDQLGDPVGAFHAWSTLIELQPDRAEALRGLALSARGFVRSVSIGKADESGRCPLCGR